MMLAEETAGKSEVLENVIATAQRLLRAEKDESKITAAYISQKVALAAQIFDTEGFTAADQQTAVTILIQRFSHRIGASTTLKDTVGHKDWLSSARKKDWRYWRRYRDYLEAKLAEKVVVGLDEATDDILRLLEDPLRSDSWDRRGLVVGHVQSGKTSNYSGLICKAADAGYKIIIVLAGTHNNLRSQTQMRLEEGFLGYETTVDRSPGMPIGVAEFGDDLKTNSATTRADNGDFNSVIAKHFHGISPEERPWLFVVKKQKSVLTALLNWIQSRVADATDGNRKVVTKLPLLVIDDEADNASVDTGELPVDENGKPDEEHKPKTINSLIRQLLHAFTRKAYVGYTATPFANIFIHHKGTTTKEGPDLFPRSFIINLSAPSNYVGPTRLFGKLTKDGRVGALPLDRAVLDYCSKGETSGWMPPKHKKTHVPVHDGMDSVPPSLLEALYAFVLACAVRELRGQGGAHSSMLIHVTRFVDVQDHVRRQVEDVIRSMRQKIGRGIDVDTLHAAMKDLWDEDFVETHVAVSALSNAEERPIALPAWNEVLEVLPEVLDDIQVRSINGTAKDALDYATPGSALKVIAIGGDKLARGLTLEGLCVSYFVRTTKMYDTLMQMGRWFGYRPGYLDLCRLYTSPDLVQWFGHIADASEELREEFDFMASANLTPEQYGLKVKSHEILTVTSPVKMRSAETLSLTFSGTRPQTILFHRDERIQQINLDAADNLIASLGTSFIRPKKFDRNGKAEEWPNSRLWLGIDSSKVLAFLGSYETHPKASTAKAAVLADFIEKMNDTGQLREWNVALLTEGSWPGKYTFAGGITVDMLPMRRLEEPASSDDRNPTHFSIGVLTEPADEGIDMDDVAWREALDITKKAWKPDPARGRLEEPMAPSGKGLRIARKDVKAPGNRGLLMLYPLAPYAPKSDTTIIAGWDKPIMAFAIAFPASDNPIEVEYEVTALYWTQEYGPTE